MKVKPLTQDELVFKDASNTNRTRYKECTEKTVTLTDQRNQDTQYTFPKYVI